MIAATALVLVVAIGEPAAGVTGEVAGTWTVERARGTATLRVAPFARLPRGATAALRDEAEALVRFIDDEATAFEVSLRG